MKTPIYNICIESYSRKVKLYWNRMLNTWTEFKENASPFSADEIDNALRVFKKMGGKKEIK